MPCGAVVTYTLMEDIVDFCTIDDAEHVFFYLETRIEALRSLYANFEKSPAKMAVLRICNQLSRRCAPALIAAPLTSVVLSCKKRLTRLLCKGNFSTNLSGMS